MERLPVGLAAEAVFFELAGGRTDLVVGNVGLPRAQHCHAGGGFGDDAERDLLHLGHIAVISLPGGEFDVLAFDVFDETERAGADRVFVEALDADFFDVGFGPDRGAGEVVVADAGDRFAQSHDDLVAVRFECRDVTALDVGEPDEFFDVGRREGEQHVIGGEFAAVVEQHVVTDGEAERQAIGGAFPVGRDGGFEAVRGGEADQGVADVAGDVFVGRDVLRPPGFRAEIVDGEGEGLGMGALRRYRGKYRGQCHADQNTPLHRLPPVAGFMP